MAQLPDVKEGETLLKLEDIHMYFGKVAALNGVSLEVKKGEIHSIIGPNGHIQDVSEDRIVWRHVRFG
mgnify:CR=1 FL=1